jgi:hypothetical protein
MVRRRAAVRADQSILGHIIVGGRIIQQLHGRNLLLDLLRVLQQSRTNDRATTRVDGELQQVIAGNDQVLLRRRVAIGVSCCCRRRDMGLGCTGRRDGNRGRLGHI